MMKKITKKLKEAKDRFSGAAVESKIKEYSEIYGAILLGIHKDMQSQKRTLEEHSHAVKELRDGLRGVHATIQKDIQSQRGVPEEPSRVIEELRDDLTKVCAKTQRQRVTFILLAATATALSIGAIALAIWTRF